MTHQLAINQYVKYISTNTIDKKHQRPKMYLIEQSLTTYCFFLLPKFFGLKVGYSNENIIAIVHYLLKEENCDRRT